METITLKLVVVILLFNLILTITIPAITWLINYVFRSNLSGWVYQELKESRLGWYSQRDREENLIFLDIIAGLMTMAALAVLAKESPLSILTCINYILTFLLALPLLRWLVDVPRNLRIKKDTGDSQKLEEMQAEINNLKSKIDK